MMARYAPPECTIDELWEDVDEHNARLLNKIRPSRDSALDIAAWAKTQ